MKNLKEMYGKAMSIPDELMMRYFMLVTDMSIEEQEDMDKASWNVGELHPRDAKMQLAHTIVRLYHGEEAALEAEEEDLNAYSNNARCLQIFLNTLWMHQQNQSLSHNSVQMLV